MGQGKREAREDADSQQRDRAEIKVGQVRAKACQQDPATGALKRAFSTER